MSKTASKPKARAQHPAQHERDAARRYLEHSHSAETLSGEPAAEANRNAQAIDEEHPRARDIALTGTDRELGKLPAHLRRHQLAERQRAGISAEQADEIRRGYRRPEGHSEPAPTATPRPRRERARAAAGAAAGGAGAAASTVYDAASDTSWGELIGQLFIGGAVLSLLYLFLTRAKAAGELFSGATNIARAVISPVVDPLNPKGAL